MVRVRVRVRVKVILRARVRVRVRVRFGVPLPSSELSSRIMPQKEASSASGSLLTVVSYLWLGSR